LEIPRAQFSTLLDKAHALVNQQKTHTAAKQDLTRQVEDLLKEGKKLATFLRVGVKQHYGNRNEKLVEFDVQPLRSRPRIAKLKVTTVAPLPVSDPDPHSKS
jgi:hypothetical protein